MSELPKVRASFGLGGLQVDYDPVGTPLPQQVAVLRDEVESLKRAIAELREEFTRWKRGREPS